MGSSEYSCGELIIIDRFMKGQNKGHNCGIYLGDYYFVTGNRYAKVLFNNEIIEIPYKHLKKLPEKMCGSRFK